MAAAGDGLMNIAWTTPQALWLLILVPIAWFVLRYARTYFNNRQRTLQTVVRSLLLALLVLALARPVISAGSSRLSVVYLVDVSHSVDMEEISTAAKKIDELNASVKPAFSRIVAFGKTAATVGSTQELLNFGTLEPKAPPPVIDRTGTDLDAALMFARASMQPGALPRIVLFSDGRPTAGDTTAAIARLNADGVPVSVIALKQPNAGDTWIDSIDVPARISAGANFAATVHITSQRAGSASLEIKALDKVVATKAVQLPIGSTAVTLDVTLESLGAQAIEATVTLPGDPAKKNDRLDRAVTVAAKPKVLYVEGTPASSRYLAGALSSAGVDVAVRAPQGVAFDKKSLEPFDVVVLSDIPRSTVADSQMKSLAEWVETAGGGLLIAGGENIYGEGEQGYRKTELERIAPVTFERRDEPEIALVIVLDKSWSMNGQVMELCKSAAIAAIDALADEQSVGVVTFNDGFDWDVPLQNVGKRRAEIKKAVASIEPSGQTMIYPAVEQAYKALMAVKARAKHVVLLSDGRSYPDDYEGLVKKMVAAKMTVSAVAVGQSADGELLKNIANWGKGRSYMVADAREVPQIFVKEAKEIPNASFEEKSLTTVMKNRGFLEGIDFTKAPALRGRTATVIKDSAVELLATKDGDPLLAFWPAGLGRAAIFTGDVKDRWGSNWVTWRSYGPFFSSIIRALERRRPLPLALTVEPGVVHGSTRTVSMSIEAHDADGKPSDFLTPKIRVQSGAKPAVEIQARQTAPGHYEARAIVDADATFAASVVSPAVTTESGLTSGLVVPDVNEEYRFRPADEPRLRSIAAGTGGHWQPTAEQLGSTAGEHRASRRPLWPTLLWTALALWMVDLLLRRVRLFEKA
jgi:Ca-activated chloride channel family protein